MVRSEKKHFVMMIILCLLITLMVNSGSSIERLIRKLPASMSFAESNENFEYVENLVFLGDSLIYNPERISKVFSRNGHQVFAGMGMSLPQYFGLTKKQVTIGMNKYYVTGTLKDREFNGIVIMMGSNDLAGQSEDVVFRNYKKLLQELQEFTSAPVYVMRTFPSNPSYSKYYGNYIKKNDRITALNHMLYEYCEENEGVYYIDTTSGFIDQNGLLIHDYGDGLHIHPKFYNLFYQNIIDAIKDLDLYKESIDIEYYDENLLYQHWAYEAIQYTLENQLFFGYPDGSFCPNVKVSRGMFVTVLGRVAKIEPGNYRETVFSDITEDEYSNPYITWAFQSGIAKGTTVDGQLFEPNALITREQMAIMVDRFLFAHNIGKSESSDRPFQYDVSLHYNDIEDISSYAVESVNRCTILQLLTGDEHQLFLPKETATRAEVATVVMRLKEFLDQEEIIGNLSISSPVVMRFGQLCGSISHPDFSNLSSPTLPISSHPVSIRTG